MKKIALISYILLCSSNIFSQSIRGKITNINNIPIEDVNISTKNGIGCSTDNQGNYILNLSKGNHIINFQHISFSEQDISVKLSKREKASTIDDYIKLGILSDALRNYLLRLGWSHKDKEIFTLEESIKLFNLKGVGKSPSKLDVSRILSMNEHYIKNINEKELFQLLKDYCQKFREKINNSKEKTLLKSINFLKNKK